MLSLATPLPCAMPKQDISAPPFGHDRLGYFGAAVWGQPFGRRRLGAGRLDVAPFGSQTFWRNQGDLTFLFSKVMTRYYRCVKFMLHHYSILVLYD